MLQVRIHAAADLLNPGQRSRPLTADDRGAILGEEQLASTRLSKATESNDAKTGSTNMWPDGVSVGERTVMNQQMAQTDRQRMQDILKSNFVR